jgi:hypothetical protein
MSLEKSLNNTVTLPDYHTFQRKNLNNKPDAFEASSPSGL